MGARLAIVLALLLVGSSLALVQVSHRTRQLYTALDRAETQALHLAAEHEHLQAERGAQARPLRVEEVARAKLAMRHATPAVTHYLPLPADVPAWPASQAPRPVAEMASATPVRLPELLR